MSSGGNESPTSVPTHGEQKTSAGSQDACPNHESLAQDDHENERGDAQDGSGNVARDGEQPEERKADSNDKTEDDNSSTSSKSSLGRQALSREHDTTTNNDTDHDHLDARTQNVPAPRRDHSRPPLIPPAPPPWPLGREVGTLQGTNTSRGPGAVDLHQTSGWGDDGDSHNDVSGHHNISTTTTLLAGSTVLTEAGRPSKALERATGSTVAFTSTPTGGFRVAGDTNAMDSKPPSQTTHMASRWGDDGDEVDGAPRIGGAPAPCEIINMTNQPGFSRPAQRQDVAGSVGTDAFLDGSVARPSSLSTWGDDGDERNIAAIAAPGSRLRLSTTSGDRFDSPTAPDGLPVGNADAMQDGTTGASSCSALGGLAWRNDGDEYITNMRTLPSAASKKSPLPPDAKGATVPFGTVPETGGDSATAAPQSTTENNESSLRSSVDLQALAAAEGTQRRPESKQQQTPHSRLLSWGNDDDDIVNDTNSASDGREGGGYRALPLLSRLFRSRAAEAADVKLQPSSLTPAPAGVDTIVSAAERSRRRDDPDHDKDKNSGSNEEDDEEVNVPLPGKSPLYRSFLADDTGTTLSPDALASWADEDGDGTSSSNNNNNSNMKGSGKQYARNDDVARGHAGYDGSRFGGQYRRIGGSQYTALTISPPVFEGARRNTTAGVTLVSRRHDFPLNLFRRRPSSAIFDDDQGSDSARAALASTFPMRIGASGAAATARELPTPATALGSPWPDDALSSSRGFRFQARTESSPLHVNVLSAPQKNKGSFPPGPSFDGRALSVDNDHKKRGNSRWGAVKWFGRPVGKPGEQKDETAETKMSKRCLGVMRGKESATSGDAGGEGLEGVRVWRWWDNARKAPGFLSRLCACALAVCALWMTSLSVAASLSNNALRSPSLNDVISAVFHAYYVVKEQRENYEMCVARQSVVCDTDFDAFSTTAREETETKLASTVATYEAAKSVTESCNASLQTSQVSLKTWLAQGTGHVLLYSGECNEEDEALVADLLGDVSSGREDLVSTNAGFAMDSVAVVAALSTYAVDRSAYDVSYVANKSEVVFVYAERLIENVTDPYPGVINTTFEYIADFTDTLVSCVSPRGDDTDISATTCPHENVRDLLDEARAELDTQLTDARDGFQDYADAFEEYKTNAENAYENMIVFYDGVTAFFTLNNIVVDLPWADLDAADFFIASVNLPSAAGILTGFADVLTASEIWDQSTAAYADFLEELGQVGNNVSTLAQSWEDSATARLYNLSISFELDDYDPPRYANASNHNDSVATLESTSTNYEASARVFGAEAVALLDGFGPRAANLSFPTSDSLNHTFQVDDATTVFSSTITYNFAGFASSAVNFGSWAISTSALGFLFIFADYFFRCTSSVRLVIKFWGRAGLDLPDADLRADKPTVGGGRGGGIMAGMRNFMIRVILHPYTTIAFFSAVTGVLLYYIALIYLPLYYDYRAGCVEHTQPGSFFTQNAHSVAYNYAADGGNRDTWVFQDDHTTRRATLCVELTASVREYLTETDLLLRQLFQAHGDDVTKTRFLKTCLDIDGMDTLYEGACCGMNGYDGCTANSTLECPLDYSSGMGTAFSRVGTELANQDCNQDTIKTENWKVEDGIQLDCDAIPPCTMTCGGPNEELIRAVTLHAGCTVEWFFHATWLKGVTVFVMFLFMNVSRAVLVAGIVKLNWRRMHTGIFTYKGTCTRAGELVVQQPGRKAKKGRDTASANKAKQKNKKPGEKRSGVARFSPIYSLGRGGTDKRPPQRSKDHEKKGANTVVEEMNEVKDSIWLDTGLPKEGLPRFGGRSRRDKRGEAIHRSAVDGNGEGCSGGGRRGDDHDESTSNALLASDPTLFNPQEQEQQEPHRQQEQFDEESTEDRSDNGDGGKNDSRPLGFKEVIAGAVEYDLEKYETSAWRQILFGILLNLPWIGMLLFALSGNVEYVRL